MKDFKIILVAFFSLFLLTSFIINQNNITRVTYKVVNVKLKAESKFSPKNLEFELLFDNNSSIFKLVDKLDINDGGANMYQQSILILCEGLSVYYNNIKENEKLKNISYNNVKYNIAFPKGKYKWKILNESKIINGFKCYKATCEYMFEDKGRDTKQLLNPTVWFTSEIPCSFGPIDLNGLPGLVLEGTPDGVTFYLAEKINKNYSDKIKIEKPVNSIDISEEKFDEYMNTEYGKSQEIRKTLNQNK
jgi:GLPGLI family protein